MTREEALKKAINIVAYFEAHFAKSKEAREDAANIIEALEQEPCEDAIRRQAVLETLDDMDNALDEDRTVENYKELLKECYEVLPSVNPQPKTGHWMIVYRKGIYTHLVCDKCLSNAPYDCRTNYCPNCGCRMVEPQERSEE